MSLAEKYGVSHKVKFLGSLPHEKVFEYLDNIDLYIQPSKTEGMPRALIEAMSRGCPAIGSNTGGIPELLNKEFVFKKGSVKELCNLLKRLNKEEMQKEANRNFEKAKEYNKELLDQKRTAFFKEFVRMV
jgi:glycosyltransferase involved in cell wall biosynthesis